MIAARLLPRVRRGLALPLLVGAFVILVVGTVLTLPIANPIDLSQRLAPPSAAHWLGADPLGRDLLARLVEGGRVTLALALASVVVSAALGGAVGLIAGYFGGWTDRVLMRLTDLQLALPTLVLALLILAALGPGLTNLILILALTGWTRFARVVRGEARSLRTREFVLASQAIGAGPLRIMIRHLAPNIAAPMLVLATLEIARVILVEAALSYLGLGVQPPAASWGRVLAEGEDYIGTAWWLVTFPGLVIFIAVLGVNLVGDALRRRLAPNA